MRRLVTQVADRSQPVAGELPLVTDIPLRQVRRSRRPWHVDVDPRPREGHVGARRERASARIIQVRVGESAGGSGNVDRAAIGWVGRLALVEEDFRGVEEDSAPYAERVPAVSMRVPDQSEPRRKVREVPVPQRPGKTRIAYEEESRRRILINRAGLPGGECAEIEISSPSVLVGVGKRGLPTQTGVHSNARGHLEGVLDVQRDDTLPQVVRRGVCLAKPAWAADQEIGQGAARERAVEREGPVFVEAGDEIVLGPDEVDPKGDLVPPADPVHVIGELETVDVEVARRARAATHAEGVVHGDQQEVGHLGENVDAEVGGTDLICRGAAIVAAARPRGVERIQRPRAERVSVG